MEIKLDNSLTLKVSNLVNTENDGNLKLLGNTKSLIINDHEVVKHWNQDTALASGNNNGEGSQIFLRPYGADSTTNQVSISAAGKLTTPSLEVTNNTRCNGQLSLARTSYQCNNGAIPGTREISSTNMAGILAVVRYSNGLMGSVDLTEAYTLSSITMAKGWYNFLYIPHRIGGTNGAATGDNCNYGNLIMLGMTVAGGYVLRFQGGNANTLIKLY